MVGTFGPLNAFRVGRSCKDQTVVCVWGSEKNYLFNFFSGLLMEIIGANAAGSSLM